MYFLCHLIDASMQGVYESDTQNKQYAFPLNDDRTHSNPSDGVLSKA